MKEIGNIMFLHSLIQANTSYQDSRGVLKNSLIEKCGMCGEVEFSSPYLKNGILVKDCKKCKTTIQELYLNINEYLEVYEKYDELLESTRRIPYSKRYEHDLQVAEKRFKRHGEMIEYGWKPPSLDIGCSNGAHVDYQNERNFYTIGTDIRNIYHGKNRFVMGNIMEESTINKIMNILQEDYYKDLPSQKFNTVTVYDVLEHLISPKDFLVQIKNLLGRSGYLIIDVPDFYSVHGKHHWKPIEHLYFFNEEQLEWLFRSVGYWISKKDRPIPGKIVYYLVHCVL